MDLQKLIESLSPNERKILPYLEEPIVEICKKANLDKVSVIRALEYLANKKIIRLEQDIKKVVDVGVNGALYRKKELPERRLLHLLDEKRILSLQEAQKESELSDDEFKASLGALKKKALVEIKKGKIIFSAKKEEISKKTPEELLLESLPLEYELLTQEQQYALDSLKNRKEIVEIREEKELKAILTSLGKNIIKEGVKTKDLIEQITPEILKKENSWRRKKFRRYDITSPVPEIHGGKEHFVNQAIDYGKKIWLELGFKEMVGSLIQSSFWNFDALFTAQDHSVRDLQDTFYLNKEIEFPNKDLVKQVKQAHEKGVAGSKGWNYKWDEQEAKKAVLRTHTTCLSAQTLVSLKENEFPGKFFSIGKCFRNETVDWKHGFEFIQTEGIVVDPDVTFNHLLGYLKKFYEKMGFSKIRFTPAYFPYTEPSVEVNAWHPEKKVWLELGGAGIFRPEVTKPLLGKAIPVLAWGQGFDRILIDYYKIKDLRELNKNDLTQLRKIKSWMK
jgi:phenylalanyl-tRNA synthetase alpha chain